MDIHWTFTYARDLVPPKPQEKTRLTCIVESKEQWAGDGEGQDPDDGDHDSDSTLGAVTRVVQHGHGHSCVPARVRASESGVLAHGHLTLQNAHSRDTSATWAGPLTTP